MRRFLMLALLLAVLPGGSRGEDPLEWKAGVGRVVITPSQSVWLSGYSGRTRPAEGKVHDLYAKALALESASGAHMVLVTCDLGSFHEGIRGPVAAALAQRHGLRPESLIFNVSHTHCAPEIAAERRIFHDLADAEEERLARYIDKELVPKLVTLVEAALADLAPAKLWISQSSAGFASNRRFPTKEGFVNRQYLFGPVDHDVPVLRVTGPDDRVRAVVFGYACHNTTLNFYQYCGDYAGFAQEEVEKDHPGVIALFVMGCGGDQNPYPRHGERGLEYCRQHGRALADAVGRAMQAQAKPVRGPLRAAHEVVSLPLEPLPPRESLERDALGPASDLRARKARYLLEQLKRQGNIPLVQPCPLQAFRLGDDLLFLTIGGETVVDYARYAKYEFRGPMVWVAGYSNDVFAYLPSLRVLIEGGYEGRSGILHQLTPTPFDPSVEDQVMGGLRRLVAKVSNE